MILFNGNYECEVEMDETPKWIQADGNHLPEYVIQEIGRNIEKKFE